MQEEKILQMIIDAEQKFKMNNRKGCSQRNCMVEKYGNLPILLSAPHAVKQIRNGQIKASEFFTGAIAECLAKQLGCSCIAKQYLIENANNDDPNTDDQNCLYKCAVNQFMQKNEIKLFVDIHGLSYKRDSVIDICIDNAKNINNPEYIYSLQNLIESRFGNNKCSIDKYFSAFSDNVMSKWVHSSFNITAIELEINGDYRWFEGDKQKESLKLFQTLKEWLENLKF